LKCPLCKNKLPDPKTTSYIMEHGRQKVFEFVCPICGTKVITPLKEVEPFPNHAM